MLCNCVFGGENSYLVKGVGGSGTVECSEPK